MPAKKLLSVPAIVVATLIVFASLPSQSRVNAASPPDDGTIKIDSGMISGMLVGASQDVRVYKGIPYAAPPVGDLRWKAPQAVKPWDGVRECTQFGSAEPQANTLEMVYGTKLSPTNEDCLYLNVYRPATHKGGMPVMVWIHGGGFILGEGATYDGENLARLGAVVVTINYRLGVFGFFAHPALDKQSESGVSGNYGMLDQIAALKWVKRNITAFGGDAARVTIFGESAGGQSVAMLLSSPLSAGLFQRAIIESGVGFGPGRHIEDIKKLGEHLCDVLGASKAADPIAALRAVSAEDLLKNSGGPLGAGFGPAIDGWFLPDDPPLIFAAGKEHNVPLIIGSNHNEGTILLRTIPLRSATDYENFLKFAFKSDADAVLKMYPPSTDKDQMSAADRVFSDRIAAGSQMFAEANAKINPKSYLYHFTKTSNAPRFANLGAYHAAEIPYIFDGAFDGSHFDDKDQALAKAMSAYWFHFASTGDPNAPGLPEWPKVGPTSARYIEFGTQIKTGTNVISPQAFELLSRPGGPVRTGRQ